ncbi:DinB family protein [Granulicella cerasi]|uniref:DinB family protein n=1 Tax=Granulicella cerasi TaxID=741063 RepID=A0ABW1Z4F9_9BACT|nr:DinB family protein [Granulicella cerasi]
MAKVKAAVKKPDAKSETQRAAEPKSRMGVELRKQLLALLDGGQAHATFDDAVKGFPPSLQGELTENLPYSGWQLLEHLRIAQRDILDFSRNQDGSYKALNWPDDYWPKEAEPPSAAAWNKTVVQIREDRKAFEQLIREASDDELIAPFPWGDGQNLLRQTLLIADHTAYHVGEMVVLRRLFGQWKK